MSDVVELPSGHPGPDIAKRVGDDECDYCGSEADFQVWFVSPPRDVMFLTCSSCSRKHRIHAQDLVEEMEAKNVE